MKKIAIFLLLFIFLNSGVAEASDTGKRLAGQILLQVEENGEAWYVSPTTYLRHFLGRPNDAFKIMREQGVGISNKDLEKISVDIKFSNKHLGEIFLQVEKNGEAWYLSPVDKKKYFLGRPADAFVIMRDLGLGVNNKDLERIVSVNNPVNDTELEKIIHKDVNSERTQRNLSAVQWNSDLARVAELHSQNLADENASFTGLGRSCDYPMIHHEGLKDGFYNSDRLKDNDVFYYSEAGENIALYSAASFKVSYYPGGTVDDELDECPGERSNLGTSFKMRLDREDEYEEKKQIILREIREREVLYESKTNVEPKDFHWYDYDFLSKDITDGWMNSLGHRANILNSSYDEAGVGVVIANGYVYATQVFIKRAECGFRGGPCCTEKGYLPYCFVSFKCNENVCL